MRLLLDTHIFLWYISADPQLPVAFRAAIEDPANEVFLSVASVWEADDLGGDLLDNLDIVTLFNRAKPRNGPRRLPAS